MTNTNQLQRRISPTRHRLVGLLLAVVVAFAIYRFSGPRSLLARYELQSIDARFALRGERPTRPDICIITIDDQDIQEKGWPISRRNYARLVDKLAGAGAKVIAFDLFFTDPFQYDRAGDQLLTDAVKRAGNVAFGLYSLGSAKSQAPSSLVRFSQANPNQPGDRPARFGTLVPPRGTLPREAAGAGFTDLPAEMDGIYRRAYLVGQCGDRIFFSLPAVVAAQALGVPLSQIDVRFGQSLGIGKLKVPIDGRGLIRINFLQPPPAFTEYRLGDVLTDRVAPGTFQNKLVFVASIAQGTRDIRPSPLRAKGAERKLSLGVEVLATVLDNLLSESWLRPVGDGINILFIFAFGLLVGLVVPRLRPLQGALFAAVVLGLYALLVFQMFFRDIYVEWVPQSASLILGYLVVTSYRLSTEEREKKRIKSFFGTYVTQEVAEEILTNPAAQVMGGERREISILFSDIRGFTPMSEKLAPEGVVTTLNEYFEEMANAVFEFGGSLNQFIGDAIMAVFGAPIPQPDHAQRAVQTALRMGAKLQVLRNRWQEQGRPVFEIGVGINTGEAVVGNVGSQIRRQYTVIGDAVNVAQRLEALTKEVPYRVLITEATYQQVKDIVEVEKLEPVVVKGRQQPLQIYAVLGPK